MLQPFEQFKAAYIRRLLQLNKCWLVSQQYHRGATEAGRQGKTALLLTDYEDAGQAKLHYNAVRQDRLAAIIDLNRKSHQEKLLALLQPGSAYLLFWSVVRSAAALKRKVDQEYKDQLRRYIEQHTDWDMKRKAVVHPTIDVSFGEIFISLRHGGQQIRLKFEQIEDC